jgi:glycerol-3-phosphate O-acyltransferase/dihydroxyacetone phosphate acyltransferase
VLILATWYFLGSSYAYVLAVGLPVLLYSHIRVLEEGRSIAENVFFLFNIAAHADKVAVLRKERERLAEEVRELVTTCVDAKFLSAVHKSLASSPAHRRLRHRASSTSDTLLAR